MATSKSTKLLNALRQGYGLADLFQNAVLHLYISARPADADTDAGGAADLVITDDAGTFVAPVRASANVALSAVDGTLDTITVGGMGHNLLSQAITITAADMAGSIAAVVADINARLNPVGISAAVGAGDSFDLFAPYWLADGGNGLTLTVGATGPVVTADATLAGGVAPSNGLSLEYSATAGKLSKAAAQTWKGFMGATPGTLLWFRLVAPGYSPDGTGDDNIRIDGTVGTDVTASPSAYALAEALIKFDLFDITVS